ncbi:MAG: hypothetical protein DRN03_00085 [Thermoplasmata archaeon]|nr:MAG: hypothetical protein DRN03_00085 [Thermoplasmata archaeon]
MKFLAVICTILLLLFGTVPIVGNDVLVVGEDYPSISSALGNAKDGDTILILQGIYYENLIVDKKVKIVGLGKVIVDGNFSGTVIEVTKGGVCIENIEIRNSGGGRKDALLKLKGCGNRISNCTFYNSRRGMVIEGNCNVIQNCSFGGIGIGISLLGNRNNLSCIICRNCGIGVYIAGSKENRLEKLSFLFNGISVLIERGANNSIKNFTIIYGNENQGGIFLDKACFNKIEKGTICCNGFGVRLYKAEKNLLKHLNISMNKEGIDLLESRFNRIEWCNFYKNNLEIYAKRSFMDSILFSNFIKGKSFGILAKRSIINAMLNYWLDAKNLPLISFIFSFPRYPKPFSIECKNLFFKTIRLEEVKACFEIGKDTDKDGCSDEWEERWGYDKDHWDDHYHLDPDGDGLNNVQECFAEKWGANPFRKDIFVEIDRTDDSYRLGSYVEKIKRIFSKRNISIHIDEGELGGGEVIGEENNLSYPRIIDLYWDHFLHNDIRNPRKGIFRYVIFCSAKPANHGGFCYVGWNKVDAFIISYKYYMDLIPSNFSIHTIATVFLHELGHTLGLFYHTFEGIDNYSCRDMLPGVWKYRNYKSCMNYEYAWFILNYSDGSHGKGDFNDWSNLDLSYFKRENFWMGTWLIEKSTKE